VSNAEAQQTVRVLVVDDEFAVRDFVSRTLRQAGYQTETASDSGVALRMADDLTPLDLLVTDLRLPGVGGAELASTLLRRDTHLKVLFLTAFAASLQLDPAGAHRQAILAKPCTVTELLHAVSLLVFGHIRGPETRR
jgi:CheY-like chemotaxis protein